MEKNSKIYVAGHHGMVGSAIVRNLRQRGYNNIIVRTHNELDLTSQSAVNTLFEREHPDYIFLAAARVGGIGANALHPAQFFYKNSMIQNNTIHAAYKYGAKKLMFLGSSCIYPKYARQPITEDSLLSAPLEPTNEAYALAKITGIKMCDFYRKEYGCDFVSVMPTNLYGTGDNYDLDTSHVLPAMIRKFHEAKESNGEVTLWGSGVPFREFLHADDMADATIFCMNHYSDYGAINVGSGFDLRIKDLASLIGRVVGYRGSIEWDTSKPDGTPRKLLDSTRLYTMGWHPTISLEEGVRRTYAEYKSTL